MEPALPSGGALSAPRPGRVVTECLRCQVRSGGALECRTGTGTAPPGPITRGHMLRDPTQHHPRAPHACPEPGAAPVPPPALTAPPQLRNRAPPAPRARGPGRRRRSGDAGYRRWGQPARPAPLPARGQHPLGHPCPPRGLPGPAPPCRVSLPPLPRPGCCGQARAAPAALPSQPTPIVRAGFSQSFLSSPLSFSPAPSILSRRCWEETQDPCTPSLPGQSLAGKGSSWHIPLSGAQHRSFTLCEGTG